VERKSHTGVGKVREIRGSFGDGKGLKTGSQKGGGEKKPRQMSREISRDIFIPEDRRNDILEAHGPAVRGLPMVNIMGGVKV